MLDKRPRRSKIDHSAWWQWEVLEMGREDVEQRSKAGSNTKTGWNFRIDHIRSQGVSLVVYAGGPMMCCRSSANLSRHRRTSII